MSEEKEYPSLKEFFKNIGLEVREVKPRRYQLFVDPDKLPDVVKKLIDAYDGQVYLSTIAAVDFIDEKVFELNYDMSVIPLRCVLILKTRVPRDKPKAPSLVSVLPGARPHEAEVYDLLGIEFEGNPYLEKPFLLPKELANEYPLRKDWKGPGKP